jgi:hypothetical protein
LDAFIQASHINPRLLGFEIREQQRRRYVEASLASWISARRPAATLSTAGSPAH